MPRLFLIRHAETVDNVAGVYAGTRDSPLTNHGVLQTQRLASYLAASRPKLTAIFSSDLQRAFKTAEAIRIAQQPWGANTTRHESNEHELVSSLKTEQLKLLREQDFGFYEGKSFYARAKDKKKSGWDSHYEQHRNDVGFQDVESKASMIARMDEFLEVHLLPLLLPGCGQNQKDTADQKEVRESNDKAPNEPIVAVVSHGIILSTLWKRLLHGFPPDSISVTAEISSVGSRPGLEYVATFSNTGYLEIDLQWPSPATVVGPSSDADTSVVETSLLDMNSKKSTESETVSITTTPVTVALAEKPSELLTGWRINIIAINSDKHLKRLKRAGGGIGSSRHDEGQKTIDGFFKRQRTD